MLEKLEKATYLVELLQALQTKNIQQTQSIM